MRRNVYQEVGERFDQRMEIRRQVLDALNITLPKHVDAEARAAIRRSIINCLECSHTQSCIEWLRTGDASTGPPDFCPNRVAFQALSLPVALPRTRHTSRTETN